MSETVFEIPQATGAQARMLFCSEHLWGNVNSIPPGPFWKRLNTVAGEGLDENIQIYRSTVIRPDRMKNKSVRGSTRPGGPLPFELAPMGVNQLLYHTLGNLVSTTGTGPFTHVLKGHTGTTAFPQGFTVEKGFMDLGPAAFCGILGCRSNGMTINFNVDQTVLGSADVQGRQFYSSDTSLVGGNDIADMTSDPYTSVDIAVYEGSSLMLLGTAKTLALSIANGMFLDNNRLGSRYRGNLKPGKRDTSFKGSFMFNNMDLYNKAVSGEDTAIQIVASNGVYSHVFLFPNVQFLPANSSPKITSDAPIVINLEAEAAPDDGLGTDIQVTITCPEADITGLAA